MMDPVSQSCPSCKSSKYNNPQLRLMVNVCGHSLCESCVEVLFVRGSGLCFQCRTPIRKANFRYQLFEDPEVQKEIDIRKKILNEFNRREEDFETMDEYDKYLEQVEEIIYKLTNDIDVEETRKLVEHYKKENKELIKRNRTKQSSSMEFYERELEREQMLRERREKQEDEELLEARRKRLIQKTQMLQGFFGVSAEDAAGDSENQSPQKAAGAQQQAAAAATVAAPASAKPPIPSSAQFVVPPSHRFLPPPSGSAALMQKPLSMIPPASSLMPTPSGRRGLVTPATLITPHSLITPASGMAGAGLTNWATSADFHNVHIPSVTRKRSATTTTTAAATTATAAAVSNQADEVVFGNKTKPGADKDTAKTNGPSLEELLQPYRPELCGPDPPAPDGPNKSRWSMLEYLYLKTIVEPLNGRSLIPEVPSLGDPPAEEAAAAEPLVVPEEAESGLRRGASAALPRGSCGIAPNVFLSRCLQDSRCGLFI